nr:hypothetical protein [uncultured Rhodoferax sp.]
MKTLVLAVSGCRSVLTKFALCLIPLLVVATPASALNLSLGSISNPQVAGGTLSTVSNVGIVGSTLGLTLTINDIGAPAQVFLAAYVPAGSLGLSAPTWFCFTQNDGWQPLVGSNYVPLRTDVAAGTAMRISLLENTNLNSLPKAEVYVGYGTSVQEMIQSARYKGVLAVR